MNKIYALKYCSRSGSVIPVPEFCHRRTKSAVKEIASLVVFLSLCSVSSMVYAGTVNGDIPYQTYRDFSENKGRFSPGAEHIQIYKKDGSVTGETGKVPVPDFSRVNTGLGVATLISPQYVASVKHNGGYKNVSFGNNQNNYSIVDRNNHPSLDFHAPRLNKLVTEVIPVPVIEPKFLEGSELDKNRYSALYRVGAGSQYIKNTDNTFNFVSGGYSYLTGGVVENVKLLQNGKYINSDTGRIVNITPANILFGNMVVPYGTKTEDIFNAGQGPLASYGEAGDSGSPVLAYDSILNKWVLAGVLSKGIGVSYGACCGSLWVVPPLQWFLATIDKDNDPEVIFDNLKGKMKWSFDAVSGTGQLQQGDSLFYMHGRKNENDLDSGKNLIFTGGAGYVLLNNNIEQGAGTLTFRNSYTIDSDNHSTWRGGGVDIEQDAVVTWKINGVKGDNLHKIGTGTLKVNGAGINEGGLKVGDGTVILAQQQDGNGRVQAFSSVNIASGRPTVVLSDNRQVNPDNISWGFRGGVLDINGNDILFHKMNAADNGAVITNTSDKPSLLTISPVTDLSVGINEREDVGHDEQAAEKLVLSRSSKNNILFHGNLTGNINVRTDTSASPGGIAFDGNIILPGNTVSQSGGELIFQGHPVIHAFNSKATADRLASLGDTSVGTQPVSFNQPDWEIRTFFIKALSLKDASFRLARNAVMAGDINANHSVVTLGSPALRIDLKDGSGEKGNIKEGIAVATNESDMSDYHGNVTLSHHSVLDLREKFSGSIMANDSSVSVASRQTELSGYSMFRRTPLALQDGARMIARDGFWSDTSVRINPGARLTLSAAPGVTAPGSYIPAEYRVQSFTLSGPDAGLQIRPWTYVSGNIEAGGSASIAVGDDSVDAGTDKNLSFKSWLLSSRLRDYRNVWQGRIDAEHARMSLTSANWKMSGHSRVHDLNMVNSRVSFGGSGFSHLAVDNLTSDQSSFVLRTDLKNSDKITIRQRAAGSDNTLFVNYLRKPSGKESLNIPLVSAPAGTDPTMFKAAERATGFSMVTPYIRTEEKDGVTSWILDGFNVAPNKNVTRSANSFLGTGRQNFLTEVNNLNKRMGDLRDTQGDDGLWVRVMNGAGTGDAGYSDHYTHFQFGFDKKHRLNGAELFTGVLMSHTDSHAGSSVFTGRSRSLGGGLYTSLMLDSGAYVDLIGKYVHHDNNYMARFVGPDKQDYGTHSWYAGMEVGYRYRLPGEMYIEPQAELVYGAVSGSRFRWNADGMEMSMTNRHYNPLTGRTGVASGKTFTGEGWQVTVRAGVDYQFDLVSNGETALRDASGEHRFTGEKDSRMLYNVGVNARLKDNVRFGVELEQSAFGKYNVDHVINVNLRYMF
ncbi:TPA: autotransporter outer membrane beta-barrel domain-containing protein [Salmonella enterica]|uniref:Autotransporter outer membrane beta-barrel domain-containing protein n=1 Tax=Salmonella enterica TaxID=28901 RepID=A0A743SLP7_SALER|nr:autotransporter outer membrane beta-barrel domain-containing protein [Salmonella enterica]